MKSENVNSKLSISMRSALRLFTYYYANQTLGFVSGIPKLTAFNYLEEMHEMPSNVEMMYSIFANNIEMDVEGRVVNFDHSVKRASQFVASCLFDAENNYVVEPPFEDWEIELH